MFSVLNFRFCQGKDDKEDLLVRDKKKVPLSGSSVVPAFTGFVLLGVPTWLIILLPAAILCQIALKIYNGLFSKTEKAPRKEISVPETPSMLSTETASRKLDLVIYGATGFTGKIASKYVAKNYGKTLKWGIAGRRRDALEKVRQELGPELQDLPLLIADSSDHDALKAMVKQTKVVISTAGPFMLHGTVLVAACAEYGTHYCDITGEADWVRQMILRFDGLARRSGSRIVHFCGHDCVPWDLSVLALSQVPSPM
jgi:hypothetical protein